MHRKIITTADGSSSIFIPEMNEHYHSRHGAVQESYHVFIEMGFNYLQQQRRLQKISVLEVGFGTALNAFITFLEAKKRNLAVDYTAVEAFPLSEEEIKGLNYPSLFPDENSETVFEILHSVAWESKKGISDTFFLKKEKKYFSEINDTDEFDLIYFDAFGPQVQPELWTEEIFAKMFQALKNGGILVTYCAKGSVRRAMQAVGFLVERLPGPPGKREMLRAVKRS